MILYYYARKKDELKKQRKEEEEVEKYIIQYQPLNRIILDQHNSDNIKRMIQITDSFCVLLRYNGTSN